MGTKPTLVLGAKEGHQFQEEGRKGDKQWEPVIVSLSALYIGAYGFLGTF